MIPMPFKSRSQARKIAMLEHAGRLPKGTYAKWKRHTRRLRALPERVGRRRKTTRKRRR